MIYFRKFLDMLFTSIMPSIVAFLFMWRFMGYNTWLIGCIICTIIFFGGNALLIRRFARDMVSKYDYYITWIPSYIVYTGVGLLCLLNHWMYPYTWVFFHTRIFEIITMNLNTPIKPIVSFIISMVIYFVLIISLYPVAFKKYQEEELSKVKQRELEHQRRRKARIHYEEEREKMKKLQHEEANNDEYDEEDDDEDEYDEDLSIVAPKSHKKEEFHHHHHHSSEDDDKLYTKKELLKMDRMKSMETQGKKVLIRRDSKGGSIIIGNISEFLLNIGSYSFYQMIKEKKSMGLDTRPIVRSYIKKHLTFGKRK